jgi:DnaK suppressor protein
VVDFQPYKQRLLELERDLSGRTRTETGRRREQARDVAGDVGDAGQADETASEDFADADRDSARLTQVREALKRIQDGTFGKCIVDGRPIEAKRLEAAPWTPYCLEHQSLRETVTRPRTPTL